MLSFLGLTKDQWGLLAFVAVVGLGGITFLSTIAILLFNFLPTPLP